MQAAFVHLINLELHPHDALYHNHMVGDFSLILAYSLTFLGVGCQEETGDKGAGGGKGVGGEKGAEGREKEYSTFCK